MQMKNYMTAQRRLLLNFLEVHSEKQFSVDELNEALSSEGISQSAIYRNIDKLAADGVIRRFTEGDGSRFLYQYVGGSECAAHLHLKCTKCGRIIHLDGDTSEAVINAALTKSGFIINKKDTMLLGLCRSCK
jgi:Fur family ferric uptake transcriptional regulator